MIRKGVVALALIIAGSLGMAMITPAPARAADACAEKGRFLTFLPWYTGLTNADCRLVQITDSGEAGTMKIETFILKVVFNVVEMLLQLSAYIASGFVIYGGFIYLTSAGSPDKAANGRRTVTHALVGLVIAVASVALVNLVGRVIL